MTTKELRNRLHTIDPSGEKEVWIKYLDPTGWLYKSPVIPDKVEEGENDADGDTFDLEGNQCEPYEVILITFEE